MSATPLNPYQKSVWTDYVQTLLHEAAFYTGKKVAHVNPSLQEKIQNIRPFLAFSAPEHFIPQTSGNSSLLKHYGNQLKAYIFGQKGKSIHANLAKTHEYDNAAFQLFHYHQGLRENLQNHPIALISKQLEEVLIEEKILPLDQKRVTEIKNRFICKLSATLGSATILCSFLAEKYFAPVRWLWKLGTLTLLFAAFAYGWNWLYHHNNPALFKAQYEEIGKKAGEIHHLLTHYDDDMKILDPPAVYQPLYSEFVPSEEHPLPALPGDVIPTITYKKPQQSS